MTGRAENKRGKGKRGELLGKMKSHGDGNKIGDNKTTKRDCLKNNQETDFSDKRFSPEDEKAEEAETGVGLEVDQKENCEQNAKQKKT